MAHDHSNDCEACVPLDEMELAEELASLAYDGSLCRDSACTVCNDFRDEVADVFAEEEPEPEDDEDDE